MTKKQKNLLRRILAAAVLFVVLMLLPARVALPPWLRLVLFLVPYLIVGYKVLWTAARNIRNGQVFDENFLMAVASLGAFGCGEYPEAVAVMLFYQVGELFENIAVGRSRKSISDLMDIRPDYANIERGGALVQVDPDEVHVGDTIVVKAGEKIPLDGVVLEGESSVDTAALTGESLPRDVAPGSEVVSGCVNLNGLLRVAVKKEFGESTVSKILELVENSSSKKAKAENFITKFARYYTPIVVFAALALAVIPSLLTGDWTVWIQRGLTFLVVSCPCALVISVPLSFFGGIGGASKKGVLVKGGNYLEALAGAGIVVFDKTGTLTKGNFAVSEVRSGSMGKEELLELAALAEGYSDHPISRSLKAAYGKEIDLSRLEGEKDYTALSREYTVFGRVSPNDKRELIRALQRDGHGVAMVGDGVNDIPALKTADCSLAMAGGSDAACRVAQMTLLSGGFDAMPQILLEGRRVINNITRAASLFLVKNLYSMLLSLALLFLPFPYPFAPIQLTLISTLTIGAPSFILALQPSREKTQGRFLENILLRALPGGICTAVLLLTALCLREPLGLAAAQESTLCTVVAAASGLVTLALTCLPFHWLRACVVALMTIGMAVGMLCFPKVFYLTPLDRDVRLIIAGLCASALPLQLLLAALVKRLERAFRRKKKSSGKHSFPETPMAS